MSEDILRAHNYRFVKILNKFWIMKEEKIHVDFRNRTLKIEVNGIGFWQEEFFVVFIPSLGVSAYGTSMEEAKENLNEEVAVFSTDLWHGGKKWALNHLKSLGWEKGDYFNKRYVHLSETTYEDIIKEFGLDKNTEFENIPVLA